MAPGETAEYCEHPKSERIWCPKIVTNNQVTLMYPYTLSLLSPIGNHQTISVTVAKSSPDVHPANPFQNVATKTQENGTVTAIILLVGSVIVTVVHHASINQLTN